MVLGIRKTYSRARLSKLSIREARIPALIYVRTCVSRAYITHSLMQHASRVTVQWRSSGRSEGGGRGDREEARVYAMTKEREEEKRVKGEALKWGHPSSPGRCFRLRRPCRLINNTISLFLRAFLSFSSASASSSSGLPLLLPSSRYSTAARKPN